MPQPHDNGIPGLLLAKKNQDKIIEVKAVVGEVQRTDTSMNVLLIGSKSAGSPI
jgi:hypothetical protein